MTSALYELRAIKYLREIELLRRAGQLYEAGQNRAIAQVHEGQTALEVRCRYYGGALEAAMRDPALGDFQGAFVFISAGTGARSCFGDTAGLASGDLIKFDCGVTLSSYDSDCGRTYAFGKPSEMERRVCQALQSAHARARELMRPLVKLSEVYHAATEEVRAHGFPNYSRGHLGHSIGLDSFVEEPPFISASEHRELQPGMVLCLEVPYYAEILGAFLVEDMLVIAQDGCEIFNTLPYDLIEL